MRKYFGGGYIASDLTDGLPISTVWHCPEQVSGWNAPFFDATHTAKGGAETNRGYIGTKAGAKVGVWPRLSHLHDQSTTFLIYDTNQYRGYNFSLNHDSITDVNTMGECFWWPLPPPYDSQIARGWTTALDNRHGHGANFLFLDGHAEWIAQRPTDADYDVNALPYGVTPPANPVAFPCYDPNGPGPTAGRYWLYLH
jgi:prepilin-type processing-associated H-X9-DG protein